MKLRQEYTRSAILVDGDFAGVPGVFELARLTDGRCNELRCTNLTYNADAMVMTVDVKNTTLYGGKLDTVSGEELHLVAGDLVTLTFDQNDLTRAFTPNP